MGSYSMGYHYDRVQKGKGWRVMTDNLEFNHVTKKSANQLKRELEQWGHTVTIEKEEYNV